MRLEDGAHRREAALLVDRVGRDVGDDGDARHGLQRSRMRGEPRRQELDLVLGQEHDVRLAAELVVDVGGRRVGERLPGLVLRGVEQRRRRRRHDGADIAARPHDFLEAVAQGRRIDRRGDDAADLGGEKELDLLDHLGGVVVGERPAILESAILGGRSQPVVDALHELALVVLREGQHLLEARRRGACRRRSDRKAANTVGVVMPGGPSCAAREHGAAERHEGEQGSPAAIADRIFPCT